MTVSGALLWPVSSPWKLAHDGTVTAYLSSRQRTLLLYIAGTGRTRGLRTLEELSRSVGVTSRGQVSRELRRLRQLELIGYRARRGAKGRHHIWMSRAASRLRAVRRAARVANDSASTPSGRFISRRGVESAAARDRRPPGAGGTAAGVGPRRGHDPPRKLYARCPAGHSVILPRGPWTRAPSGGLLRAEWSGVCRRCGDRPVREVIELELVAPLPRPLSPAELADPALLERRRAAARAAVRDPAVSHELREQIRRDYLDERE